MGHNRHDDYVSSERRNDVSLNKVRHEWANRTGEFSPIYYAHHGPNETSHIVHRFLEAAIDLDDPVLEIGCSAGRHLVHLHRQGYTNLWGVDVNGTAFDVMHDTYPALARDGTFIEGAIEDVVESFTDDQFAAVFSVETLQHVHPDASWTFAELVRITANVLITAENERCAQPDGTPTIFVDEELPLYFRAWDRIFSDRGTTLVDTVNASRTTVRAFTPNASQ